MGPWEREYTVNTIKDLKDEPDKYVMDISTKKGNFGLKLFDADLVTLVAKRKKDKLALA